MTMTQSLTLDLALTAAHPKAKPMDSQDWRGWLNRWATYLQVQGSPIQAYELSLKLTNDDDIRELNRLYRHKDQPTDVLSFAALETDSVLPPELLFVEPLYLGDIVISLDTAERQAQRENHSLLRETIWLTAHGFLHLLGWDHPDDESLEAMLAKQTELFALIVENQAV